LDFLKTLLKNKVFRVTVILIVLLFPFTSDYRVVFVNGESMHPTYRNGEMLIEEKASSLGEYWKPNRGKVIVVITDDGEKLIKRVVGLSGDTIQIKHGRILLNKEIYKDPHTYQNITFWLEDEEDRAKKPRQDWLFLNTDTEEKTVPEGYIWVIGDNRHMSWYGLVRIKEIEGKVLY
tara:strand:- start:2304 stop:2834 length:531 start_codon:yes stop_codon:yes gene_type:complete